MKPIKTAVALAVIFCLSSFFMLCEAQEYYWVGFRDKKDSPWSVSNPRQYLSEKAIQRRAKQGIPVDESDLPVNPAYVTAVRNLGVEVVHSSKWLNGVTVRSKVAGFSDSLKKLSFVKEYQLTKPNLTPKSLKHKFDYQENPVPIDTSKYGLSVYQTGIMNGQYLHNNGFQGKNMVIGVLDAGFYRVNQFAAFSRLRLENRILGTHDFVNPLSDIYQQDSHGMSVLSTMGGYIPGSLIGTAPEASYWLIRTEDSATEYLIEEDNWVAGAEFADSIGVDVINSSLGYTEFDDPVMNHAYRDMDGKTTRITRGANFAASKGILVFISAGNERNKKWHYISAPSDGDEVICVAAVNKYGQPASFSSAGPASDGDVKPNAAAIGWNTVLQGSNGSVAYSNGTSFSSPVLAGMGACLWQSNPGVRARDVKLAIEKSCSLYLKPDTVLGYGIPDFRVADQLLKALYHNPVKEGADWLVFPSPFKETLFLHFLNPVQNHQVFVSVTGMKGTLCFSRTFTSGNDLTLEGLDPLPAGIYILNVKYGNANRSVKIVKMN